MSRGFTQQPRVSDSEWLDHIQPVGLVVSRSVLKDLGLVPIRQTVADSALVASLLESDTSKPALSDPWKFVESVLGWETRHFNGAPGATPIPRELVVSLDKHGTTLRPTWAAKELGSDCQERWQLLVRVESAGVDPDARGVLDGWEATPHQRLERLLRDTGVFAGVLITDRALRLVYAPRGETSGYLNFPLRPLGTVAGRPMLSGLKLLLDRFRLFSDAENRRLPALLKRSREAQASVSTALAGQVLGALYELLRGLDGAESPMIREVARSRPNHLYEGLLTVLMRLVFVLYAEDRDLLPSRTDGRAREIYESSYSLRGLYAKLTEDAALNPDTMDERRGAWGQLLALFRLVHSGHKSGFMQARGGKLFDPSEYLFLEGRQQREDPPRALGISDGCILRILEGLMSLRGSGGERERLSYRALDVEQIGSVYETVMGFTVEVAAGHSVAIKAGKNNRTPVFVDLEELLDKKGKNRVKHLKESTGRQLSAKQAAEVEDARSIDDVLIALDSITDERASPLKRVVTPHSPILQPTGERRRSGSYYTPRLLTAPIVRYALEPIFARLGAEATPEHVLEVKVCDPAMGSGAFLVEACRVLGERLVKAWTQWPERKPAIPSDEDEELHAQRLVAQRCLYGVDKNSRAVDLAKLSLWLATLARDHEFTFLDHALRCGDSLVGLTMEQIQLLSWDSKYDLPLYAGLLREKLEAAALSRREIREAADDVTGVIQETRYRHVETQLKETRLIGNSVIAAFFSNSKPKLRERARQEIEACCNGPVEEIEARLKAKMADFEEVEHSVVPFHWEVEFPEVFLRTNPGFEAIVGNPPFLGGSRISTHYGSSYLDWLLAVHPNSHGNGDLVAHFFRTAWRMTRVGGTLGLIATKTIRQGDTRSTGLEQILSQGGMIYRATRRLWWPGDASVVVSVLHVAKEGAPGSSESATLDGRPVQRISAYLVSGNLDGAPAELAANAHKAFNGSKIYSQGFLFDDEEAGKGRASTLHDMRQVIARSVRNADRIFPYIGGDEVNTDPRHAHYRYVIDFFDRPLGRRPHLGAWADMTPEEQAEALRSGLVPQDYPGEVAEDWPDLIEIVRRLVKPYRDVQTRPALKKRWWQYGEKRPGMVRAIAPLSRVLVNNSKASPQYGLAFLPNGMVYSQNLNVFALATHAAFCAMQCRIHELWARFFSATLKDDLAYTPSDAFRTFPFPDRFESDLSLERAGADYYDFRASMMVSRNEGLTKIYNRFHDQYERATDIARLRELHSDMDVAVLHAYEWHDLAEVAAPTFTRQHADDDEAAKTRLAWPEELQDEVLSRLLVLNARCAASSGSAVGETEESELEENSEEGA